MRTPWRTAQRLSVALLLVTVVPLIASIMLAEWIVEHAFSLDVNPAVVAELERSLGVYADLAKAMKEALRAKADAIAAHEPLRAAALLRHKPSIEQELAVAFATYPDLVSVEVQTVDGEPIARRDRGRPVDESVERTLEVRRPLAEREGAPEMVALFAAPRARLDDVARADQFVRDYRAIERQRAGVKRAYLAYFAALVGLTLAGSATVSVLLARSVTRRLAALAGATQAVGAGDLTVRVDEGGGDEITDLARAFNTMLGEVEESRARIEFLRRIGAWQEMARRLAHEIKNPLTPIQLAVEECHRRYRGEDPAFRRLLDTTLEIVAEEVGTLRRLVSEFGGFARLPAAELAPHDASTYLREQRARFALAHDAESDEPALAPPGVSLGWHLTDAPLPVALDPIMFHRVLINLIGNAAQAAQAARPGAGRVEIGARAEGPSVVIDVDDDRAGVPPAMRSRIFDPYVTTKAEGTGLGLAIVKKIVVEHGGSVEVFEGPIGGARFRIRLPRLGTPASDAALADAGRASGPPSARA